jgi:hypothetical protein
MFIIKTTKTQILKYVIYIKTIEHISISIYSLQVSTSLAILR